MRGAAKRALIALVPGSVSLRARQRRPKLWSPPSGRTRRRQGEAARLQHALHQRAHEPRARLRLDPLAWGAGRRPRPAVFEYACGDRRASSGRIFAVLGRRRACARASHQPLDGQASQSITVAELQREPLHAVVFPGLGVVAVVIVEQGCVFGVIVLVVVILFVLVRVRAQPRRMQRGGQGARRVRCLARRLLPLPQPREQGLLCERESRLQRTRNGAVGRAELPPARTRRAATRAASARTAAPTAAASSGTRAEALKHRVVPLHGR
mmetsp:Transcript_6890/g.28206  ORF Transcript_6890/g.28206 Transcript_6890/m.28206 type:complete len:267 (-) Transcript_6890:290-1090(-)